jgi:SprT-like family
MNGIKDAITELERIFTALVPLFNKDMPKPVITIQSKGRKRCLAWFVEDKWQNDQEEPLAEINICAESLARPVLDIGETMVHEMCHQANWLDGIKDCTVNQYHNTNFRDRAEGVGLVCQKSGRGWADTTAGDELLHDLSALKIDPEAFSLYRLAKEPKPKKTNNLKKYSCGCSNCWAKTPISATCKKCNKVFLGPSMTIADISADDLAKKVKDASEEMLALADTATLAVVG